MAASASGSAKVGAWPTLGYTVAETNYEYIAPAG